MALPGFCDGSFSMFSQKSYEDNRSISLGILQNAPPNYILFWSSFISVAVSNVSSL